MQLTSAKNPHLQNIRRALRSGRALEDGLVAIEGPHLLREALRSQWRVEQVLVTPEGRERHGDLLTAARAETIEVPARVFAATAGTETSQQILALLKPPFRGWADCLKGAEIAVVLDGVQDPGNAGTIVRSAEAFGAGSVILVEGSVRLANGKFLRAAAGSVFRLPCLENQDRDTVVKRLLAANIPVYALDARAETLVSQADLRGACAIVVGSEARGVSPELQACSRGIRIPTGKVESLNAGVACSIALFEAARQRGGT